MYQLERDALRMFHRISIVLEVLQELKIIGVLIGS